MRAVSCAQGMTAFISAKNCSRLVTFFFALQASPANVRCSPIVIPLAERGLGAAIPHPAPFPRNHYFFRASLGVSCGSAPYDAEANVTRANVAIERRISIHNRFLHDRCQAAERSPKLQGERYPCDGSPGPLDAHKPAPHHL